MENSKNLQLNKSKSISGSPISSSINQSPPKKGARQTSKLSKLRLGLKGQVLIYFEKVFLEPAFLQQNISKNLLTAYSGGLDSTVLLHILASLRDELQFSLSAMHVHHGLSPNADFWADFCQQICKKLDIPLKISPIQIPTDNALGIEAAARKLRYEALFQPELNFNYVCFAHHQNDQAETLLLQLARGAGIKGLSGMAAVDHQRRLLRPLLHFSRAELEAYAAKHGLTWIEDESNQNNAFDRNFFRNEILPKLHERHPSIVQTLSRSASHIAEASKLLNELAAIDAQAYVHNKKLNIEALHILSASRARNLLRWWLVSLQQPMPSAEQLGQMLSQLGYAKTDAQIKVVLASKPHQLVTVQRYKNEAYLITEPKLKPEHSNLLWQGEAELILPDNSRLIFSEKLGAGMALKRLDTSKLRVSYRQGSERFKPDANRPTRSLKHLLQETNMPPWQREWLPLVYMNEKLALVPGLGIDSTMQAQSDEIGWVVEWLRE